MLLPHSNSSFQYLPSLPPILPIVTRLLSSCLYFPYFPLLSHIVTFPPLPHLVMLTLSSNFFHFPIFPPVSHFVTFHFTTIHFSSAASISNPYGIVLPFLGYSHLHPFHQCSVSFHPYYLMSHGLVAGHVSLLPLSVSLIPTPTTFIFPPSLPFPCCFTSFQPLQHQPASLPLSANLNIYLSSYPSPPFHSATFCLPSPSLTQYLNPLLCYFISFPSLTQLLTQSLSSYLLFVHYFPSFQSLPSTIPPLFSSFPPLAPSIFFTSFLFYPYIILSRFPFQCSHF